MKVLGSVFLFSIVAAFVPVLHIETYIAGMHVLAPGGLVTMAAVAAIGQSIGKTGWYEAGRGAVRWAWLARKLENPKFAMRAEALRLRVEGHPWISVATLLLSSGVSLPPMAIMAVVAGHLRINRLLFVLTVLVGRFARFLATLGVLDVIVTWLR